MNERLMLRFALMASGLALTVSLFSLWQTKQSLLRITDHELKLEAQNAVLQKKIDDGERNAMGAVAAEMESLRADLGVPAKGLPGADPRAGAKPYSDELISAIGIPRRRAGVIEVTVPAGVAAAILATPLNLAAEVPQLSPAVKNKKPDGFSLYEIRQGGLAGALGFEKGDVIHSVGQWPFRTTEEIQAAWDGGAFKASRITFQITREDQPLAIVVITASAAKQP